MERRLRELSNVPISRLLRVEMYYLEAGDEYGMVVLDSDKTRLTHMVAVPREAILDPVAHHHELNDAAEQLTAVLLLYRKPGISSATKDAGRG